MNYEFLTQDERDDIVAEAMKGRELEHFHYTHNAAVYEQILTTLPTDAWPADLVQFQGKSRDEIVRGAGARADVALQYLQRDQLLHLKATEAIEAANIERIHAGLVTRFDGSVPRRTAAVNRIKAR